MNTEAPWNLPRIISILVVVGLAAALIFLRPAETDTLNVPLGVEQAAIVTYSGPLVSVAPYKWGVAVNVRIADIKEMEGRRVYDVRYIVNRAGTFDLKDYLVAENGSDLTNLPTFKFTGDAKLSKNLDTRIQETEAVQIDVGGRYYEIMALLTVLWLVWLLLLIFYKRPREAVATDEGPAGPMAEELLALFRAHIEVGTLSTTDKARMEMLLLRRWRDELALGALPMDDVLRAIGRDARTGAALKKLQQWLHQPVSSVKSAEIAALLAPAGNAREVSA
ncbi:MAG TPA: hypothetical protein VGE39_00865 [Prosthecobacter sp.]